MSVSNPEQLVAEFKKSGEFDRLRRELLNQFKNGPNFSTFMSRVDDIVQQRLSTDEKLPAKGLESIFNELMHEMDRFPLVERSVAEVPGLSDPAFKSGIRQSLAGLLKGEKMNGKETVNESIKLNGKEEDGMDDSDVSESESSEGDADDGDGEESRSKEMNVDHIRDVMANGDAISAPNGPGLTEEIPSHSNGEMTESSAQELLENSPMDIEIKSSPPDNQFVESAMVNGVTEEKSPVATNGDS